MVRHAGWIFLLALVMGRVRGIIKMSQLLSPVTIRLSVCSLNNTNRPMQCPSFKFQLVSFSLLIFFKIHFHVPFVVIVNVLGYCCFSHIHCSFVSFLGGWGRGSKDNHCHFINIEWILDLFRVLLITHSPCPQWFMKTKYYSGDVSHVLYGQYWYLGAFYILFWIILQFKCDVFEPSVVPNLNEYEYTNFYHQDSQSS